MSLSSEHSEHSKKGRKQRSKLEALRVRNDVRRLESAGKNQEEICKILDLSKANFYYYQSQITKEDRRELQRQRTELIAHEILTVRDRLLYCVRVCHDLVENTNTTSKDKIDAMRLMQETSLNIIRLLNDGPKMLDIETSTEDKAEFDEDTVVSDAFIAFAEATAAEKFQRDDNGGTSV